MCNQKKGSEMEKLEFLKKWWIGKKVISVSNAFQTDPENNSLKTGVVMDVVPITQSETPVPVVLFDGEDEPFITFSAIMEYSEMLLNTFSKLNPEERWNLMLSISHRFK